MQVLDELCDLNLRLYAWVAPGFSRFGAPARGVIRGLRALLLLLLKNLPIGPILLDSPPIRTVRL